MIDGGLVLIVLGLLAMVASPIERSITHRRYARESEHAVRSALVAAHPVVPPSPSLDCLVRFAERALAMGAAVTPPQDVEPL